MTGHGGWPLTAFCDPDGVPFHCGTYFPPEPRQGMPSFRDGDGGGRRRPGSSSARRSAGPPVGPASSSARSRGSRRRRARSTPAILDEAVGALADRVDPVNGGFGGAPKFPPASALDLLLARGVTEPVELTLDAMAAGGIHDQLGGGFARYSVDARWLVPHFEKMLYDNALLARTYLRGVAGARARALPRGLPRDPRMGARRDARPRGRLLLGARRRLRGESRAASTPGPPRRPDAALDDAGLEHAEHRRLRAHLGIGARPATSRAAASCTSPAVWTRSRPPASTPPARRCSQARAKRVRPGPRRQAPARLERAHGRRAGRGGRGARRAPLRRRRGRLRRLHPRDDARRRRPPAADLQRRPRAPQRLPGGPRLPARGAADVYEATLRSASLPGGARDRRRDDRALRRRRERRLLHHLRRPRGADRPPQGPRRPSRSVGQLVRRPRPAAPRGAERRGGLRGAGRRRPPAARRAGAQPPRGLRLPARRDRLLRLPDPRGRADRARPADRPPIDEPPRRPVPLPAHASSPRRRGGRRRAGAARRPPGPRRRRGRLRLRALRLQGAGRDARGARGAARA